jgi:hypothetical protein
VLTAADAEGRPRLWLVPVDRGAAPQQVPGIEGHLPAFGPDGELVFRDNRAGQTVLYRVREDGSGLRQAIPEPAEFIGLSFDRRLLFAEPGGRMMAYPLDGGPPRRIWGRDLRLRWSSDGRALFVSISSTGGTLYGSGRTYVIPLSGGRVLPEIPEEGFGSEADLARLANGQIIEAADVAPGPRKEIYVFSRESTQRNLYRVPVR